MVLEYEKYEILMQENPYKKCQIKSYQPQVAKTKMSRACCPACTSAVHLTSTNPALAAHLLEQTVCAICWRPLLLASYPSSPSLLNLATSEVGRTSTTSSSCSSNLEAIPRPLLSACGHLFHPGCLEDRGRTYPDTPDRSLNSFLPL